MTIMRDDRSQQTHSGNRFKQSVGLLLSLLALVINYSPQVQALRDLPDTLLIRAGQEHELNLPFLVTVDTGDVQVLSSTDETLGQAKTVRIQAEEEGTATLNLSWLGLPMKELNVEIAPARTVMPGGQAIGVALTTNGVLVVGTSDISGAQGGSPAVVAGLKPGDLIQAINNEPVESAIQLTKMVNQSAGQQLNVRFQRKDSIYNAAVTPILDRLDGQYRLGVWVRDSTAGVGTLSFYDPSDDRYGALGHAITDVDTGTNLTVREGRVLFSEVLDIQKGKKGQPGELRGSFLKNERVFGDITMNNDFGVYGQTNQTLVNPLYPQGLPVGAQSSVHTGPATILTTLDEGGIHEYEVEITRVNRQPEAAPKSMTLKVTDPVLLERTGGIVQGMSGSPILQDGHIIGAVTHVFVNDPTQGYGIFIEWMLAQADQ
jgi:stage IV sporulation protein B